MRARHAWLSPCARGRGSAERFGRGWHHRAALRVVPDSLQALPSNRRWLMRWGEAGPCPICFASEPMDNFGGGWKQQECRWCEEKAGCPLDGAAPARLSLSMACSPARLGKRDRDRHPAARPGAALALHEVVCLLQLTGPLTTRFCIVLLRNLNVQPVKRGIKALTLTFNCYLYFWKGVAVRIKYFVGIK